MRRVRLSGLRIPHHLGVAVIGGDQHRAAGGLDRRFQSSQRRIHRSCRLLGGVEDACVTNHIAVGIVDDDHLKLVGLDRRDQLVGDLGRRHRRLQIVGGDFRRRHENALLAWKHSFLTAIEEEGHVRVLLRLSDPELAQASLREHRPENVAQRQRREQHTVEPIEIGRILDHAKAVGKLHRPSAVETGKLRIGQSGEYLARPVSPEIRHEQTVTVFHAPVAVDDRWQHELVRRIRGHSWRESRTRDRMRVLPRHRPAHGRPA